MFRRPVLALLSQPLVDSRCEPAAQVRALHRDTVNELLALSVLGPVLQTDLRVSYTERLFATDASPDGAGIVEADLPRHVVKEFWRFSEQRGFYTRLANPAADCLEGLGLDSEPAFGPHEQAEPLQPLSVGHPLAEGVLFDVLELFSDSAAWSEAHRSAGLRVHPGFTFEDSSSLRAVSFADLSSAGLFHELRALALRGVVGEWHASPPAGSFLTLGRPRSRSKSRPSGFGLQTASAREHTMLARRTAFLLCLVVLNGGRFSVVQPGSSVLFYLQCFVRLASSCSYGPPFKRPLQILHNKGWLLELGGPWQVDKKWQAVEPGERRPVISKPIVQAAVTLALAWGWNDWAAVTLIGAMCMLHPSEIIPLVRRDLVLPSDAMSGDSVAYVHIRNPKTQRFARRQHSRHDDPVTLQFLHALYRELPLDARLFRASMHVYRRQWNAIMARLGVPYTQAERGATPGVLRGSGATYLYLETEDISLVAWRGRWSKVKTVEFYLPSGSCCTTHAHAIDT